jgi:hypothetical protein
MKRRSLLVSLALFLSPLACRVERVKDKGQIQAAEASKSQVKSYEPVDKLDVGDWPLKEAANELDYCIVNPPVSSSSTQDLCSCLIEYASKICSYDQFVLDRTTYLAAGINLGKCR